MVNRFSAAGYLRRSVQLARELVTALLDEAERTGEAIALWGEDKRRPGVTDVRATVTYDGTERGYEVHRPGCAHGSARYNYLDDLHPVDCTECYCAHYRHNGRSGILIGDAPSTCQCGHLCAAPVPPGARNAGHLHGAGHLVHRRHARL